MLLVLVLPFAFDSLLVAQNAASAPDAPAWTKTPVDCPLTRRCLPYKGDPELEPSPCGSSQSLISAKHPLRSSKLRTVPVQTRGTHPSSSRSAPAPDLRSERSHALRRETRHNSCLDASVPGLPGLRFEPAAPGLTRIERPRTLSNPGRDWLLDGRGWVPGGAASIAGRRRSPLRAEAVPYPFWLCRRCLPLNRATFAGLKRSPLGNVAANRPLQ